MEKLLNIRSHIHSNRSSCERSLGETFDYDFCLKNNSTNYSNFNSLSDTELNESSKFDDQHQQPTEDSLLPRRFSTESSNFYRFATVTPINMSPLNDPRKDPTSSSRSIQNSPAFHNSRMRNLQLLNERRNQNTPTKPERKSHKNRRSISLNSYDGKKLFSPLRTYVVVMKENLVPKPNNISDAPDSNRNSSSSANLNSTTSVSENNGVPPGAGSLDIIFGSGSSSSNGSTNQRKCNTSSVLINSSGSHLLHETDSYGGRVMNNAGTNRFHSLPRERMIRIEREDSKFVRPGRTGGGEIEDSKLNKNKSTIVEISRSPSFSTVSSALDPSRGTVSGSGIGRNVFTPPSGVAKNNRISRSQSYREISTSKPAFHDDVPLIQVRLEKSSSNIDGGGGSPMTNLTMSGTATLPIIRSRTKGESSSSADSANGGATNIGNNKSGSRQKASSFLQDSLLLDDKESMNVVENFLRSHHQRTSSSQDISSSNVSGSKSSHIRSLSGGGNRDSGSANVSRTNEKSTFSRDVIDAKDGKLSSSPSAKMIKDSSKRSDFVQEQMDDFKHFQRQQIHTFDNYLRQSSTFPRALHKSTKSQKGSSPSDGLGTGATPPTSVGAILGSGMRRRLDSEPVRKHTSTTTISSSDKMLDKHYDGLDAYFHPSSPSGIMDQNSSNNERIVPIVVVNGVSHPSGSAGWSATLPHPYIRKHRQQKATFLEQQEEAQKVPSSFPPKKVSPTISDIEREIERDIYFQKTQSLDRGRSNKFQSTSIYFKNPLELEHNEDTLSPSTLPNVGPPPVASPRLKRKAKLLQASTPNLNTGGGGSNDTRSNAYYSVPKINAEQSTLGQQYVSGEMGTNYRASPSSFSVLNKNTTSTRLPNEPRPSHNQNPNATFDNLFPGHNKYSVSSQVDQSLSKSHKGSISLVDPLQEVRVVSSALKLSPVDLKMKNRSSKKSESVFADAEHDTSTTTISGGGPVSELEISSRPSHSELSLNLRNPHPQHEHHHHNNQAQSQNNQVQQSISSSSAQQVEEPAAPIATPRTRRKNSFSNRQNEIESEPRSNKFHDTPITVHMNQSQTIEGDTSAANGMKSVVVASNAKAVRFEPHIIEMEMENERKHNEARSSGAAGASNISHGMRMNKNFNNRNKLQERDSPDSLDGDESPVTISSAQQLAYMKSRGSKSHTYHFAGSGPLNRKTHHHHHHSQGGIKSSANGGSSDKDKGTKALRSRGFVARAIAKVKSKASNKGKSSLGKLHAPVNTNNQNVRSIETRDSITYISPPPTHADKAEAQSHLGPAEPKEIPLSLPDKQNQHVVIGSHEVTRTESFNNKGILKHDSQNKEIHSKSSSFLNTDPLGNFPPSKETESTIIKTPQKPKRRPNLKMDPLEAAASASPSKPIPVSKRPLTSSVSFPRSKPTTEENSDNKSPEFSGLEIDQLTPSSSSSSSSSYLSNLQESYDFFHDSEECESIGADDEHDDQDVLDDIVDESEEEGVFKSFDDDEDAGEDFIFYSNQLSNRNEDQTEQRKSRVSHAYNGPAIRTNSFSSVSNNNIKESSTSTNDRRGISSSSSNNVGHAHPQQQFQHPNNNHIHTAPSTTIPAVQDYHKKGGDILIKSKKELKAAAPATKSSGSAAAATSSAKNTVTKGLDDQVEDNRKDGTHHPRNLYHAAEVEGVEKTALLQDDMPSLKKYHHDNDKKNNTIDETTSRLSDLSGKKSVAGVVVVEEYIDHVKHEESYKKPEDDDKKEQNKSHQDEYEALKERHALSATTTTSNRKRILPQAKTAQHFIDNSRNKQWDNLIDDDGGNSSGINTAGECEQSQKKATTASAYGTTPIVTTKPQQSYTQVNNIIGIERAAIKNSNNTKRQGQSTFVSPPKISTTNTSRSRKGSNSNSNLLLPSSFIKNPYQSQSSNSEFFPGRSCGSEQDPAAGEPFIRGMSSFYKEDSCHSVPSSVGNIQPHNGQTKYKSRVIVNPTTTSPEEEQNCSSSEASNSSGSGSGSNSSLKKSPKKNVTRVEISGDVGIVTNASAFLNSRKAQLKKVNEGLWKNEDAYSSSGLTQLSNSNDNVDDGDALLEFVSSKQQMSDEDNASTITSVSLNEVGSSVSANAAGGDGGGGSSSECKIGSSSEEDGSSDWHSESTKNTVIFRGSGGGQEDEGQKQQQQWSPPHGDEPSNSRGVFPYNCDPEIHISSITLLDRSETGSAVTSPSVSPSRETNPSLPSSTPKDKLILLLDSTSTTRKTPNDEALHSANIDSSKETRVVLCQESSHDKDGMAAARDNAINIQEQLVISGECDSNSSITTLAGSDTDNSLTAGKDVSSSSNNSISSSTPSSVIALADSSEELSKSNETLTDLEHLETEPIVQMPEELDEEGGMVQQESLRHLNRYVPSGGSTRAFQQRRESPEGQEQEVPTPHPDEKDSLNSSSGSIKSSLCKSPSSESNNTNNKKVLGLNEVVIMEEKHSSGGTGTSSSSKNNKQVISKSKISQNVLSQMNSSSSRSSPDGQDAERSEYGGGASSTTTEPDVDSPTPMIEQFDVTSDDDSWVEEIIFEDDDDADMNNSNKKPPPPPPLDLTLHTIVEESCEESEAEGNSGNFNQQPTTSRGARRYSASRQNDNELEKYFNFGIYSNTDNGSSGAGEGRNSLTNDESEFSDTFSESSFSIQDDQDMMQSGEGSMEIQTDGTHSTVVRSGGGRSRASASSSGPVDPAELASSRLEKYFFNLGLPQSMINPISSINQTADSDSVGSESESDNSVLENRKKVLKHHRRSADFEDEFGDKVSDEEEDFGFGQDGFDTIKKTSRKVKKSGSEGNLLESSGGGGGSSKSSENLSTSCGALPGSSSDSALVHSSSSGIGTLKEKSPLEPQLSSEGTTSSSSKEESSSASPTSPPSSSSRKSTKAGGDKPVIKVNRSNSFTWSSDEEVNIMMSKLRALIKNLIKSKTDSNNAAATPASSSGANMSSPSNNDPTNNPSDVASCTPATAGSALKPNTSKDKDKQLAYLENELIRLMKSENLKNIVEYFSSEESDVDDVYKFIKVVKESGSNSADRYNAGSSDFHHLGLDLEDPHLLKTLQSTMQAENDDDDDDEEASSQVTPKGSPALLAKVMHHIGNRLAVWMKDENGGAEDDTNDDNVTLKCAQSVSSDLNEDRFSWKGSFESALAAKRQSVGSTDSISSSDFTQDRYV
jgi:hypothetical protein